MKAWQEGKWQDLGAFGTMAFQFGFGVFETIRVRDGVALDLPLHTGRLMESIRQLKGEEGCPFNAGCLEEAVVDALGQCQEKNQVLKIIAYRNEKVWSYVFTTRPYTYTQQQYEKGFAIKASANIRSSKSIVIYHKTLNYLENYLQRQRALQEGYDDAYFLNMDGHATECTSANLFILYKGKLLTSPVAEGLLPGIMRGKLLGKAGELGLTAKEVPLKKEMLMEAEMVLVTNALYGVMPVSKVDSRDYPIDGDFIRRVNDLLGRSF